MKEMKDYYSNLRKSIDQREVLMIQKVKNFYLTLGVELDDI